MKDNLIKNLVIKKPKIKVLFVATEAAPFAQAGGLAQVMHSLPLALSKLGCDSRIMIPRYARINPEKYKLTMEYEGLKVPTDQPGPYEFLVCNVKKYEGNLSVPAYFLENMEYFEKRANVYGYSDDHVRWALFCRGVIEFLKVSTWTPDIIVVSDWHTSLIPNYLKTVYKNEEKLSKIKVILAIHNLSFQGMCDFRFVPESERDSGREPIPDFFSPRLAKLNWLLRGILYSDLIVTVSPTYAKEILTPEFGEGLEKILNEKREKIFGILNGINYSIYNPETDPNIPFNYSIKNIEKKKENKFLLQRSFGLKEGGEFFLIGMPSRLTEQKGFDLLEKILEKILKILPIQFIFIGDGESRYKEMLKNIKEKFPQKISFRFEFDANLPRFLYAGCDAILIPSKFEPCGIVQMEAMRYGAVPIARATGGLKDTIENFDPEKEIGCGFLFTNYNHYELFAAICRAHAIFGIKRIWKKIVKCAMSKDFSWKHSAKEYLSLFKSILGR